MFYAGEAEAAPELIVSEGLGGSETALIRVAEGLAHRHHDVRVFAGPPDRESTTPEKQPACAESEITGRVLYAPWTEWDPGERCDLFVSSRVLEAFDQTVNAPRRALWLHDIHYADKLTQERIDRTTDVVFVSRFQHEHLSARYQDIDFGERARISRNGIEPRYFEHAENERKQIVAYTSSPGRGLDVLLECWPAIRERANTLGVHDPELHYSYASVHWKLVKRFPRLKALDERIAKLRDAAGPGVVDRGSLSQQAVARLYCSAQVWAHPSWISKRSEPFPETSCISAMEAQAGGAIPVCLDYGALRETVPDGRGVRIPAETAGQPPTLSPTWRKHFVDAIADVLANPGSYEDMRKANRATAMELGWEGVAEEWDRLLLA